MADGDHYPSYAECQYALQNAGLGTSGNTLYDANAMELGLDISLAMIHLYLDIAAKTDSAIFIPVLKSIQLDLLKQQVIHGRFFKEQNLTDVGTLQAVMGGVMFSQNHIILLDIIKRKLAAV